MCQGRQKKGIQYIVRYTGKVTVKCAREGKKKKGTFIWYIVTYKVTINRQVFCFWPYTCMKPRGINTCMSIDY